MAQGLSSQLINKAIYMALVAPSRLKTIKTGDIWTRETKDLFENINKVLI